MPTRYGEKEEILNLLKLAFVRFWYLFLKAFCIKRIILLEDSSPFFELRKILVSSHFSRLGRRNTKEWKGFALTQGDGSVDVGFGRRDLLVLVDPPGVKVLVGFSVQVLFGSPLTIRGRLAFIEVQREHSQRAVLIGSTLLINMHF